MVTVRSLLPLTLVLILAVSCRPTDEPPPVVGDDDSVGGDDDDSVQQPDDDDSGATDDDDTTPVDDDDVTPDPVCTDGWEPLAVVDEFEANIRDYSVDSGSSTLAAISTRYLYVYDVSEARTPVLLETFDAQAVVDPAAEWGAISAAEGGHVVLGRWETETGGWAHVQLIDAVVGSVGLGFETTFSTGGADEYGTVGQATDIAARGDQSAVVAWHAGNEGECAAYFLDHGGVGLVLTGSRPIPWSPWRNIAHTGEAVLLPGGDRIRVAPLDLGADYRSLDVSGVSRIPLETEAGWLIPTLGGYTDLNELYRLNEDLTAVEQIGWTAPSSSFYDDDGAHQLAVYEDEIFVANGLGGGLLRAAWTPDDWISVEAPSTLTADLWEEYIGADGSGSTRVERAEDILFVAGKWSPSEGEWQTPSIGVVRICPL